jgi:dihydrofolate synthase / folylpolyglutamate synthase
LRRAAARLRRTRALLAALGDPHLRYPVVHVTGTSGKGSTCAAIAAILTAAGYRVGLRTSPYLQVATEKLQIGASLIDARSFAAQTRAVLDVARHLSDADDENQRPSYAEVWSGIAFSWFASRDVDVAVVEVGAGGRFDATNVVQPIVSVITSVGLDHVVSLGPTLADIAWHKAGIVKPGSVAVVGELPAEASAVVLAAARQAGAPVLFGKDVPEAENFLTQTGPAFQRTNARLAVAALQALRRQGFAVTDRAIRAGLASARLPGRFEPMPTSFAPRVWIDGAHNPDKIAALALETGTVVREGVGPVVLLGVLGAKDVAAIASRMGRVASAVVVTQPTVLGKSALPAPDLAAAFRAAGFAGPLACEPEPASALARSQAVAAGKGANVLVTGSLYLAGEIRRHWYSDDRIVLERTPWPATRHSGQ